jgi:hypothetical protein
MERLAPSNRANAIVSSFFIHSPSVGNQIKIPIKLQNKIYGPHSTHTTTKKQAAIYGRFLQQLPGSYFGGGVVLVVPFFDFLPPL